MKTSRVAAPASAMVHHVYALMCNEGFGDLWHRFSEHGATPGVLFERAPDTAADPVLVFTPMGELVVRELLDILTNQGKPRCAKRMRIQELLQLTGYPEVEPV